ncbi:MAG TPA: T9SS type A sorting domain-containing protein, partial [Chitinophagaceae bacterium]|nr:T9SS type A sorting domain-containing protein [Chitinophagaceae bacterium]
NYVVANFGAGLQKQALVYKTSVVSNVTSRLILSSSSTASTNWSSGRFPLLVTADVSKNGGTASAVNFIVVHAKANTGSTAEQIESYNRRKAGIQELKDTLDAFFANDEIIILGDYNDDLDRTIAPTTGADTVSSYQVLIADSTDANSYRAVTLPLSLFKQQSTTSFPDVIDHVTISNELAQNYLALSATIYSDIAALAGITNYAATTSDHFPVRTRYLLTGTILPVRLVDFTAVKQANSVTLNWKTAEEINTREFVLERSAEGQNFKAIGRVAAAGNSSTSINYQYVDAQPLTGNNFYRLRMVDNDNKAAVSKVAKIVFDRAYIITLWPNPARGSFTVTASTNEPINLQIVDMSGRIVKRQRLTNEIEKVNVANLIRGIYTVKMITTTGLQTQKLIIE